MENVVTKEALVSFWQDKRVFLTGHTGFKGCWMLLFLKLLGANVWGYSLPPETPSLYESIFGEGEAQNGVFADIRDKNRLSKELSDFSPDIVFHLAAQPLVRESYLQPAYTYEANVMGTVHLLEAVRATLSVKSVVVVTTDKCYKDMNWEWGYRETDALGGYDPYSSSKACVELLCDAWRNSFLAEMGTLLATARAGNVIGGGDWAKDRLIPDAIRAFSQGETLTIRCPNAVRPWQHVLEPLVGYMMLAQKLFEGDVSFCNAWNFGPLPSDSRKVSEVVERISALWGEKTDYRLDRTTHHHESNLLRLDASRAMRKLGWLPSWKFEEAVTLTIEWYKRFLQGERALSLINMQIETFLR